VVNYTPLLELLAIPLSNQKTIAKWLVIPNPLMEQLAIRLSCPTSPATSLVIPQAGEGAKVRYANFGATTLSRFA
jgi:hypothetical protein